MKIKLLLPSLLFVLLSFPVRAVEVPAAAVEMAAVERFLDLSDAELDQMQQVIARVRAMTPEQRATLRTEIRKYRQLPEEQREQLRMGWGWMPQEIQDGWRDMMQHATSERRAAIQNELWTLDLAQRMARRRQLVEEYLKTKPAQP